MTSVYPSHTMTRSSFTTLPLAQLRPYNVRDFTYTGVSVEFLYFAGSVDPGKMRPPNATAAPFSSKIGNITRARKESCSRPALLTKPRPTSANMAGVAPRAELSASHSSGAQPRRNERATSPARPRSRKYSRAARASGDSSNRA
ncbi:unannotated protein [freshwater metagenome]|uniref:Unannotated protein n=1 Tax=freshwater metagenome TaxID=449393 RepID=A0A6J6MNB1_9ZZZZ